MHPIKKNKGHEIKTVRVMEKSVVLIIPIICLLFSCEKDEVYPYSLSSKWKLEMSCGGVVGCLPASNVTTIEFKANIITEEAKTSQTSPPIYYKRSNYTILDIAYEDSKATYKIKLEDGTIYMVDVSADQLVLTNELLQRIYHKL
ncbi:hypothetical protein [Rufibacter soli]